MKMKVEESVADNGKAEVAADSSIEAGVDSGDVAVDIVGNTDASLREGISTDNSSDSPPASWSSGSGFG